MLASIMLDRASIFSPLATACRKFDPINSMALIARVSVKVVDLLDIYDSTAWVNASIPVNAVTFGGMDLVIAGSTMATSDIITGVTITIFIFSFGLVSTENSVTSLPVPDVVGIVISGGVMSCTGFPPIAYSQ